MKLSNIMRNLRDDICQSNIRTLYQPIFSNVTNSYIAFEALARIYSFDGTMYPIQDAITFAENNNLIDYVFDAVVKNIARDFHFVNNNYLTINVSPIQLFNKSNVIRIINLLKHLNLPLDKIVFEIIESSPIAPTDEFYRNVNFLKQSNIRIAVDDFDIGLSAEYLEAGMQPDIVKLDREFVNNNIMNCEKLSKLVEKFRMNGYGVIAEGVETTYQKEQLIKCGIQEFQGFLYSKPVTVESLKKSLCFA